MGHPISPEIAYTFEDRSLLSNVTTRSQTQPANETGTQVTENVSVQIRHDHHNVVELSRVLNDLR